MKSNPIEHADVFARLAAFIPDDQVRSRDTGRGGGVQLYVKVQTVMNRLDEVLGPAGWWDGYSRVDETTVECALTIRLPDGSTVTKRDVGIRKPPAEGGKLDPGCSWKAAYSDALKRAASKYGVARHLCKCGFASFVGPTLEGEREDEKPAEPPAPKVPSRGGLPSQGRPPHPPEPEPMRREKPPTNGRSLFKWCKTREERDGVGLLKYLNSWAKLQDFPGRMVEWDADQVAEGYAEAVRKLHAMPAMEPAPAG